MVQVVMVRCVKCRYIQPNRVSNDGTITPCVICGHFLGEYLADFLYPAPATERAS